MHIPDGFLSPPVWLTLGAASAAGVGWLARRAQSETEESRIPLLGVMGAFVFAAQMINFPMAAGTSGHLVGGALLAITLGPAAAVMVMTAILAVQALIFQDGGVLALGANVFNMAIAGVPAGYLPYALFGGGRWRPVAIVLGGVLSVLVSAALALAELAISGLPIPAPILWASAALFLLNGIVEGLITLAVVRGLDRLGADLVRAPAQRARSAAALLAACAAALVVGGVLVASEAPDVLETLAERAGIESQARAIFSTPLADYQIRGWEVPWLSGAAAGLVGLALISLLSLALARLLKRRSS